MARALEGMGCVEVFVNEPCPRLLDAHVAGSLSGASVVWQSSKGRREARELACRAL